MGPSHGGMQRSLEMMKQMARTGGPPDRDPVEHALPLIVGGIVGVVVAVFLILRVVVWLT